MRTQTGCLRQRILGLALGLSLAAVVVREVLLRRHDSVTTNMHAIGRGPDHETKGFYFEETEAAGSLASVLQVLRSDAQASTFSDRERIWKFILECGEKTSSRNQINWLEVDEAFFWLRGASQAGEEIETGLVQIALDKEVSESLRCFAIEHLGIWAEENPICETTVSKLKIAACDTSSDVVGSRALQVLNGRLSSRADADWLLGKVEEILQDDGICGARCVTALEIAVDLGAAQVEPLARKFTASGRAVSERVSAYLALGRLGNWQTLRWMEAQPVPRDVLVRDARERALQCLLRRSAGGS